jgi:hypothetical protein
MSTYHGLYPNAACTNGMSGFLAKLPLASYCLPFHTHTPQSICLRPAFPIFIFSMVMAKLLLNFVLFSQVPFLTLLDGYV